MADTPKPSATSATPARSVEFDNFTSKRSFPEEETTLFQKAPIVFKKRRGVFPQMPKRFPLNAEMFSFYAKRLILTNPVCGR